MNESDNAHFFDKLNINDIEGTLGITVEQSICLMLASIDRSNNLIYALQERVLELEKKLLIQECPEIRDINQISSCSKCGKHHE